LKVTCGGAALPQIDQGVDSSLIHRALGDRTLVQRVGAALTDHLRLTRVEVSGSPRPLHYGVCGRVEREREPTRRDRLGRVQHDRDLVAHELGLGDACAHGHLRHQGCLRRLRLVDDSLELYQPGSYHLVVQRPTRQRSGQPTEQLGELVVDRRLRAGALGHDHTQPATTDSAAVLRLRSVDSDGAAPWSTLGR